MTMMMDENQEFGKICWKTYKAYINAAGGYDVEKLVNDFSIHGMSCYIRHHTKINATRITQSNIQF